MKKDSNMFNDNSTETEGVPADKTAEIPKVVDSTEEENAKKPIMFFGREFSRKQVCAAGAGILCAALLIGGGAYAISHAGWTGDSNAPAVSQSKDDEKQDMVLTLEVKADGWDADTSTPVIAHIEDADGKVDFYTAIAANKQVTVKVGESGTYTVTFISPVNADGSIYKVPSKKVTAGKADKTVATGVTFDKVDADKVTKDDLTAIAKDVAEAVKKGDSTLTGDKGAEVVKKFEDNIKKNPNADTDAVEKETEKAQETAKEEKSDAKTPETSDSKKSDSGSSNGSKKDNGKTTGSSDNSGNKSNSSSKKDEGKSDSKPSGGNSSNSGSNTNSGSSSKKDDTPAHVHKYDIYHPAVTHTEKVYHPAVTHTEKVYHPAVTHTEERSICNGCGADITGNEQAHAYNALMAGNKACGAYHTVYNTVTDSAAWEETVTITDSAAWEETVTITDSAAYYTCSCGARK